MPGGNAASQNDVWVLAKSNEKLVSIAVEGKVAEPFGPTIGEWNPNASVGRRERFGFHRDLLNLDDVPAHTRYQLLHRTASAVLLVHSFSPENLWFEDFARFVSLFGTAAEVDGVTDAEASGKPVLSFAWVHGDERYLKR